MLLTMLLKSRHFSVMALLMVALLAISACAPKKESVATHQVTVSLSLLQTLPEEDISYDDKVRPVL